MSRLFAMFRIYATRHGSRPEPDYNVLVPYELPNAGDAAKYCVDLHHKGYVIHKVVLPNGREILGKAMKQALMIGVNSVLIVLRK